MNFQARAQLMAEEMRLIAEEIANKIGCSEAAVFSHSASEAVAEIAIERENVGIVYISVEFAEEFTLNRQRRGKIEIIIRDANGNFIGFAPYSRTPKELTDFSETEVWNEKLKAIRNFGLSEGIRYLKNEGYALSYRDRLDHIENKMREILESIISEIPGASGITNYEDDEAGLTVTIANPIVSNEAANDFYLNFVLVENEHPHDKGAVLLRLEGDEGNVNETYTSKNYTPDVYIDFSDNSAWEEHLKAFEDNASWIAENIKEKIGV